MMSSRIFLRARRACWRSLLTRGERVQTLYHMICRSCAYSSAAPQAIEISEGDRKRFFILGTGNLSSYTAAAIRLAPDPPLVTLLTHEERRIREYEEAGNRILLNLPNGRKISVDGIDIQLYPKRSSLDNYQTVIDTDDPKSGPKFCTSPIINLIIPGSRRHALDNLCEVKPRLCRESTVLTLIPGMRVSQDVCAKAFPDPKSRPTFRIGIATFGLMQAFGDSDRQHVDSLQSIVENQRLMLSGFRIRSFGVGSLRIGPVSVMKDERSRAINEQRAYSSQYLCDVLLDAELCRTELTDEKTIMKRQLKKMAIAAVIGTCTSVMECNVKEITRDHEKRELALRLTREIYEIYKRFLPYLSFSMLWSWMEGFGKDQESLNCHPMLLDIMAGKDSDVRFSTGWIVEEALKAGLPCEANIMMMELVEQKVKERKAGIQAVKDAKENKRKEEAERRWNKKWNNEEAVEEKDKLEIKREKKAARQRAELGNQHMPERYANPTITRLGKK